MLIGRSSEKTDFLLEVWWILSDDATERDQVLTFKLGRRATLLMITSDDANAIYFDKQLTLLSPTVALKILLVAIKFYFYTFSVRVGMTLPSKPLRPSPPVKIAFISLS